jgi:hypothetical protein
MTGKIMPLCEWGTSTIQALAGAFLSSPRYVNRNTRRGYADNPGHWRLATDSDSSPVARHAISAWIYPARLTRWSPQAQSRVIGAAVKRSLMADVRTSPCAYLRADRHADS